METKEVQVDCPCCRSRLAIDVRTAKVVRWSKEGELDASGKPKVRTEDWTNAADRVSSRLSTAEDLFDAGLQREKNRERDLDDLFRETSEKLVSDESFASLCGKIPTCIQ